MRPYALYESWRIVPVIMEDRICARVSRCTLKSPVRLTQRLLSPDLDLGVLPLRHLDDKVDNALIILVGVQRDIVPERDRVAAFLEPYSPVLSGGVSCSIGSAREPRVVRTRVFRAPTVLKLRSECQSFSRLGIDAERASEGMMAAERIWDHMVGRVLGMEHDSETHPRNPHLYTCQCCFLLDFFSILSTRADMNDESSECQDAKELMKDPRKVMFGSILTTRCLIGHWTWHVSRNSDSPPGVAA